MNKRIEKDDKNIVYLVEDYTLRKDVQTDVEHGRKVVIVSTQEDVLSFYGAITGRHGGWDLYLIDSFDDCDNDFIDTVCSTTLTKEEVVNYIGKPLAERFNDVLDRINVKDEADKRTLTLVAETLKGEGQSADISSEASIELLNDRIKTLQAQLQQVKNENKQLRVDSESLNSTTQYTKSAIMLDTFRSDTQVMYIRDVSSVAYFDTMIKNYKRYLKETLGKRAKIVIFDNRLFKVLYKDFQKIEDTNDYIGNRSLYLRDDTLVCWQIFPLIVSELYKAGFDTLIFIDRILNTADLVKGQNVHKYITISTSEVLRYAQDLKQRQPELTFIAEERMNFDDAVIINKIDKPITTPQESFYWYQKLGNKGKDKRLLYTVLDDINKPRLSAKKR